MDEAVQKSCVQDKVNSKRESHYYSEVESAKRYQELIEILCKKSSETVYIQRINGFKKAPVVVSQLCFLKNA